MYRFNRWSFYLQGIYHVAILVKAEIKVRSSRKSGTANVSDYVTLMDIPPLCYSLAVPAQMQICSCIHGIMLDLDPVAVSFGITCFNNAPVSDGLYRCAGRGCVIDSKMGPAYLKDRMKPAVGIAAAYP